MGQGDAVPERRAAELLACDERVEYGVLREVVLIQGEELGEHLEDVFLAARGDVHANAVRGRGDS